MKQSNMEMLTFVNNTAGMLTKKLPLKLAFAMKHNRKQAVEKLAPYEEMRVELLNSDKEESEKNQEFNALLQETLDIDIKTVPMEVIDLTDTEGYDHLTLGELEAIAFMIEE